MFCFFYSICVSVYVFVIVTVLPVLCFCRSCAIVLSATPPGEQTSHYLPFWFIAVHVNKFALFLSWPRPERNVCAIDVLLYNRLHISIITIPRRPMQCRWWLSCHAVVKMLREGRGVEWVVGTRQVGGRRLLDDGSRRASRCSYPSGRSLDVENDAEIFNKANTSSARGVFARPSNGNGNVAGAGLLPGSYLIFMYYRCARVSLVYCQCKFIFHRPFVVIVRSFANTSSINTTMDVGFSDQILVYPHSLKIMKPL